jgi:hypothetical protein
MNTEMQILREVNIAAEYFYGDAVEHGKHAAYVLTKTHRSQMTGLENIADSSPKVSDILDYIKRQTARFPYWRQSFPGETPSDEAFGERLKDYLEKDLKDKRDAICSRLEIGDESEPHKTWRRHTYLLLIRQFVRQVVAEYEYRVSFGPDRKRV